MPARILVVDDDAVIREMLVVFLQGEGYSVVTAPDGKDGFQMAQDDEPNLIITDLQMGDWSGTDLLTALRKAHILVPTILITGTASDPDFAAAHSAFDALISKPFRLEDALNTIHRFLPPQPKSA